MYFFQENIGDYAAATAHLSWDEDAAYKRMLHVYYQHEKPLPNENKKIFRLIRAFSKSQKSAVLAVLEEFFILEDDGYHQKRCDEEICRYHVKCDKAKASATARWGIKKQPSEGNADDMRTHDERNANYKPLTNIKKEKEKSNQQSVDNSSSNIKILEVANSLNLPTKGKTKLELLKAIWKAQREP